MGPVLFLVVGAFFLFLGRTFWIKHQEFLKTCIEVPGIVKDLVVKRSRNSNGSAYTYEAPVVEYYQGRTTYQFVAEVNAQKHNLKVGDSADVYITPEKPRVAKLVCSNNERLLMLKIMIGLGSVIMVVGAYLLSEKGLSLEQLMSPFNLIFAGALVMLCFKIIPIINQVLNGPIYHENAEVVSTREKDYGFTDEEINKDKV